eukprot:227538_1
MVYGNIVKYDIMNQKSLILNTTNLCHSNWQTEAARTVTSVNNKIYLHGCDLSSWRTLIFDTKTDQFERNTINIDVPINTSYYRRSQITQFDDNVLLLLSDEMVLYSGFTELISIDFTDTVTKIWPSDGLNIRYYLNDFTHNSDHMYHI